MVILCIGDICGRPGRAAVREAVGVLREELRADFVMANAENAAAGFGMTAEIVADLLSWDIDCLTTGNHCWAQKTSYETYDRESRLLRPANYPPGAPGRGSGVYEADSGARIGVLNLGGRIFLEPIDCPFRQADVEIERLRSETDVIIVDFHAEATSEKQAFAFYVDGRVSAVIGTHTHVQTADEHILPGGTAYITDMGMTGARRSVIGVTPEAAIELFLRRLPMRLEPPKSGAWMLQGVCLHIDEATGKAQHVQRIFRVEEE